MLFRTTIEKTTSAGTDILDLTSDIVAFLDESGIQDGQLLVFTPGSTAGITTVEYEGGAISDLARAFEELAPEGAEYRHNLRWGDGNGYSHVRAALLGPSLTLPVVAGAPELGTWQQVILCDFDNRPRRRRIVLQAMGE